MNSKSLNKHTLDSAVVSCLQLRVHTISMRLCNSNYICKVEMDRGLRFEVWAAMTLIQAPNRERQLISSVLGRQLKAVTRLLPNSEPSSNLVSLTYSTRLS